MSMTIIQLVPALEAGGVERETIEIASAVANAGHRSLVISAGGAMVKELESAGVRHITLPIGRKSPFSLRFVSTLHTAFMETGADIVHARSRLPAWLGWLALQRRPIAGRSRFVTTVHGLYSVNRYSAIMARGERVICVSQSAAAYVRNHYPGVDVDRLTVIERGVDRTIYPYGFTPEPAWLQSWQREYPQLKERKVLTLAGRVTRRKGALRFIELIGALRSKGLHVQGLIVGSTAGASRRFLSELEHCRRSLDVTDNIIFTGERRDLREIYAVSDLMLSLSEQPEAFGRTVIEALSLGRPVLGFDHGGVGEQLRAVFPAGAVPLNDQQALTERAEALLANPPQVPRDHPYTQQRMLDGTLALYANLVGPSNYDGISNRMRHHAPDA